MIVYMKGRHASVVCRAAGGLARGLLVVAWLCGHGGQGEAVAQETAAVAVRARPVVLRVETPLPPPEWALLQRQVLKHTSQACEEFFAKYFDDRGYLLCVERWGGDDGPDDAIENCNDWPLLHALGGSDTVLALYKKAWEGHLRQFTLAKTKDVPFARDGMYFQEFPVMFDWLHNGEGLTPFNLQGLSDPDDPAFQKRVRRFAGFYLNESPLAQNYDPKHRIIRSLFNGSRGPLLRKATALDWAGDPIEVEHRFKPRHGEETFAQMLEHFKEYNDIVGDHPSNLLATSLAMNAYMLSREPKYKEWVLSYVDAWRQRILDNNGIIPTNIGLDGKIGSAAGGKWYGGVYGWGFSVAQPPDGRIVHRSTFPSGFNGFMNAYALTGNDAFLDPWRNMFDIVNANKKVIDGKTRYPSKYGDNGWYAYLPEPFAPFAHELWYLSQKPTDRKWMPSNAWVDFLDGKNADYPKQALLADLARLRTRVEAMRQDTTTPDTRLSDDPLPNNPAFGLSLTQLMLGGPHPGRRGSILFTRLRYFDPERRRAGLPEDVAALVHGMTDDETTVTLVNTSPLAAREVVVQGGAYGEHTLTRVTAPASLATDLDATAFHIRLAPGAGAKLVLKMKRYANPPTLHLPWSR